MGFWDTVGKIAKGTANAVIEEGNKIQEYKQEVTQLSNSELKERYKKTSGWKKAVVQNVIKERRGY